MATFTKEEYRKLVSIIHDYMLTHRPRDLTRATNRPFLHEGDWFVKKNGKTCFNWQNPFFPIKLIMIDTCAMARVRPSHVAAGIDDHTMRQLYQSVVRSKKLQPLKDRAVDLVD